MKRIVLIFSILSLVLCFDSCKSKRPNIVAPVAVLTSPDSENFQWNGRYEGVIPCADCEGIKVAITLYQDKTYTLCYKYLGKSENIDVYSGSFDFDAKENKLTFNNLISKGLPSYYLIQENTLTQLDLQGNKITGELEEQYVLKKVE